MYNFENVLQENEKILYQGRPVPGKGGKNLGALLFVLVLILFFQIILLWGSFNKIGDAGINYNSIGLFLITVLFDVLIIYNIIYNVFLKAKKVSDDYYCITNKRVLKYEENSDKLVYGYIMNYDEISVENCKDGYGDLHMSIVIEEENSPQNLESVKNIILHPNPENMPCMVFESIQSPRKVAKIVKSAKKELNSI